MWPDMGSASPRFCRYRGIKRGSGFRISRFATPIRVLKTWARSIPPLNEDCERWNGGAGRWVGRSDREDDAPERRQHVQAGVAHLAADRVDHDIDQPAVQVLHEPSRRGPGVRRP